MFSIQYLKGFLSEATPVIPGLDKGEQTFY